MLPFPLILACRTRLFRVLHGRFLHDLHFSAASSFQIGDGLSVSVVPKGRAGMAAGIFNTSKVANEGVALATVSAILGILNTRGLNGIAELPAGGPRLVPEVAQRVIAGDLSHALALVPGLSKTCRFNPLVARIDRKMHHSEMSGPNNGPTALFGCSANDRSAPTAAIRSPKDVKQSFLTD
jgi:hypothetical protein